MFGLKSFVVSVLSLESAEDWARKKRKEHYNNWVKTYKRNKLRIQTEEALEEISKNLFLEMYFYNYLNKEQINE